MKMSKNYQEKFNFWVESIKDKKVVSKLKKMSESEKEEAFFKDIEFGTAGLRGIVGLGSNRLNIWTVGRVSESVATYMKNNNFSSVAVAYDSRNMSLEFAKLASSIFASHGITVYLTATMMPTPYLSFMVRYFKCDMGVNITASHNPKDYNGYKVYGIDGAQLLENPSYEIMKIAENIGYFDVKMPSFEKYVKNKTIVLIDENNDVFEAYLRAVKAQSKNQIENITAIYTALNGTGIKTLPKVLEDRGAKLIMNKVQCKPDKTFKTCPYPNPENDDVYDSSKELAKGKNVDLILASDPDADRIGVCVKDNGEFVHLTGNEIGILLTDYLFQSRKEKGGYLVKSIVSSSLAEKIAGKYHGETINVLTGFKYIGEFITNLEMRGQENQFVFGFEESSGYVAGSYVRDKDATLGCMLIAEQASELKKQGKTLVSRLHEIYKEFGFYQTRTISFDFENALGFEKISNIMLSLRKSKLKFFGKFHIEKVIDYESGVNGLPKANMIEFKLENSKQVIVRPSGTEPKLKFYLTTNDDEKTNAENFENMILFIKNLIK